MQRVASLIEVDVQCRCAVHQLRSLAIAVTSLLRLVLRVAAIFDCDVTGLEEIGEGVFNRAVEWSGHVATSEAMTFR